MGRFCKSCLPQPSLTFVYCLFMKYQVCVKYLWMFSRTGRKLESWSSSEYWYTENCFLELGSESHLKAENRSLDTKTVRLKRQNWILKRYWLTWLKPVSRLGPRHQGHSTDTFFAVFCSNEFHTEKKNANSGRNHIFHKHPGKGSLCECVLCWINSQSLEDSRVHFAKINFG